MSGPTYALQPRHYRVGSVFIVGVLWTRFSTWRTIIWKSRTNSNSLQLIFIVEDQRWVLFWIDVKKILPRAISIFYFEILCLSFIVHLSLEFFGEALRQGFFVWIFHLKIFWWIYCCYINQWFNFDVFTFERDNNKHPEINQEYRGIGFWAITTKTQMTWKKSVCDTKVGFISCPLFIAALIPNEELLLKKILYKWNTFLLHTLFKNPILPVKINYLVSCFMQVSGEKCGKWLNNRTIKVRQAI